MQNIGYRYVPKELSKEQSDKVEYIKDLIQDMLKTCTSFEDRKKVIYKGVDTLFKYIATTEQYQKTQREPKKFEAEEYDVENFGNISLYSSDCIDQVISEVGFGSRSEDYLKIEKELMQNAGDLIDFNDLEKLSKRTLAVTLDKEKLEFMKKTNFLSEYFKNQQKSHDCDNNIVALDETVKTIKTTLGQSDNIDEKGQISIGDKTVSQLANEYMNGVIMNSYKKAMNDSYYAPILSSKNPAMSIVCGLPGLGKSSIFINDLKKQGYLCVDLDDIAISLSKRFNVPINESTSGNIYTLANLIHDNVVAQSMERGFNIAIEKIGYDKNQIISISDNMCKIANQVNNKTNNYYEYNQSLLMAAGSSIASAESNSVRNAEQIFDKKDLRAYHYSDLIRNNNCTTYAYLSVLGDEYLRNRFSEIRISDRVGCFEGLSFVQGQCIAKNKSKSKTLVKGRSEEEDYACR